MALPQMSYLTLCLLTLAVYFMWMDVALYINLQQAPPLPALNQVPIRNISQPSNDYSYSPFYPLDIKLLFQGPTIHYIDESLAYWTVTYTNVSRVMSANAVSILGVVFAAVASRFFISDSLKIRQFGVVLFKIRDYLDSLDGYVARQRRQEIHMKIEPNTMGYFFDGICDGLADLMLFLAVTYWFYKNNLMATVSKSSNGYSYQRLEHQKGSSDVLPVTCNNLRSLPFWRRLFPYLVLMILVAGHTIVSSTMWNINLINYNQIFETHTYAKTEEQMLAQNSCLKSSTMWMVVYFWRLLNPHSINQFILIAILYNKTFEYFNLMQFLGYLPLFFISVLSSIYSRVAISTIMAAAGDGPAGLAADTAVAGAAS